MLLKEAKERVEAGEDARFDSFRAWCREYLPGRSNRDIRRMLQIANAPDPQSKLNEMRATARDQTRRWRQQTRMDSRKSATDDGITECEHGSSAPNDAEWDRKTFDRILEFLEQKSQLNRVLRISMARRLLGALAVDVADLYDVDQDSAA